MTTRRSGSRTRWPSSPTAPSAASWSQNGRIVELVAAGGTPRPPNATVFDAARHVVLPGLINTHHHFYQTLTRALPAALDRELFPWLQALYPIWARLTPEALDLGVTRGDGRTAAVRLHHHHRPSLRLSGRPRRRHRHRGRGGKAARHARAADARLDEPVAARRRPAAGQRGAGRGHDPRRQRARGGALSPARRGRDGADRAGAVLAVLGHDLADARDRRAGRASSTCACTRISPRPRTRTVSASKSTAAGRSTISRIAAGSTRGPGSRTASISTPTRCSGSARPDGRSAIAPAATRLWRRAAARSATWKRPASRVGLGVDGSASNDESNLMQEVRAAFLLQRGALRRRQGQPQGRAALGDQGLGGLHRPSRTRRDRGRQGAPISRCSSSTSCAFPATAIRWRRWCCAARIAPTG